MTSQKPYRIGSNINSTRSMHLDGIRGIAALTVALFHFIRSFDNSLISSTELVNHTFISALWNGHFAVALFFVLSGFLFFEKFYCATFSAAITASVKRYFRLCIPIFFICLAAYAIHKANLYHNKEASIASGSDWLNRWYAFEPSIFLAIKESLWSDFVSFDATQTYNSNLWTISYELFAVFLTITISLICKYINLRTQIFTLLAAAVLTFGTHYLEFILGAILALACLKSRVTLSLPASTTIALLALSGAAIILPQKAVSLAMDLAYPLAAVFFIGAVNSNNTLRRVLSNRFFLKLGEISFGLYLTHFLVLNSIASSTFIQTNSIGLTFITYALVTTATSLIFTYAIDKPWITFLNNVFSRKKLSVLDTKFT